MTPSMSSRTTFATFLTLLAACTDGTPPDSPVEAARVAAPTVRDSAGIQIVEHAADAVAHAPRLVVDSTPRTLLDERNSELELGTVSRALLLTDNRIAFFSDGSVYIIGSDGAVQERIGRSGEGPGEFRSGRLSRGAGDTLLLADIETARISFVVPGIGVLRTVGFTNFINAPAKAVFSPIGVGGADTVLVGSSEGVGFRDPTSTSLLVPWFVGRLVLPATTPTVLDTLAGYAIVKYGAGTVGQRYGGAGALAGWNGRLLLVDTRTREMRIRASDGRLLQLIRMPGTRRATDAATIAGDVETEIAWLRTRANVGVIRWDTARVFNQLRGSAPGDSLPLIDRVLIGADGLAWFKDGGYKFADATWSWTALRPDGTIAGRVTGRGRDQVEAFGTNAVLLKTEDDDGYTAFRVHLLRPAPGP